jgi:hypothetical protein
MKYNTRKMAQLEFNDNLFQNAVSEAEYDLVQNETRDSYIYKNYHENKE